MRIPEIFYHPGLLEIQKHVTRYFLTRFHYRSSMGCIGFKRGSNIYIDKVDIYNPE